MLLAEGNFELVFSLLLFFHAFVDKVTQDYECYLKQWVTYLHDQVGTAITEGLISKLVFGDLNNDEDFNDDKDKNGHPPQCLENGEPLLLLLEQLRAHFDEKVHHQEEDKCAAPFLKGLQEDSGNFSSERVVAEDH